jgi:hypothetical protein
MRLPARHPRKGFPWKCGPDWNEMVGPMLNLNREEQALTQGQAPGKRVVARSVQIEEVTAQPESQARSAPASEVAPGSQPQVDAQAVARLVIDLMHRDLQVDHERRKPGR